MGKLVPPPPPVLMSLNPNINSDLAVGAVITEFLRARALKLNPSYLDATVSDLKKKCIFGISNPEIGGVQRFSRRFGTICYF